MKTVTITIQMKVTDKFFEEELIEMKNEILSGEFQRGMMDSKRGRDGIKKIVAVFKERNNIF